MKEIVRTERASIVNEYRVTITEELVKEVNEKLAQFNLTATEQDIVDAVNGDWSEKSPLNTQIGENTWYTNGYDYISTYINDIIWDQEYETVDWDTYDTDTEIREI